MAKKEDIVLKNLKGFIRLGAGVQSPGNIPTGHFDLDFVIQYGDLPQDVDLSDLEEYDPTKPLGVPLGKIVEIFGEEGSGKSSLAYRIVGFAQKMGYQCAWIDTENSFAKNLAEINGVDIDTLFYSDMTSLDDEDKIFQAEDVFDAIIGLSKSGVNVVVLDSVANLVPKARMERNAEQITVGVLARLMSENLGKIANTAAKNGTLVVFINQLREKIGVMYGSPETSPGGRSLKHNASLRLQISLIRSKEAELYIEDEEGKEKLIGKKSRVYVRKNRFAKPFTGSINIPIYYEHYFPDVEEIMFDSGRQLKLISVRKGIFKWGDLRVEGRSNFVDTIKEKELQNVLVHDLLATAEESNSLLPPEIMHWVNDHYKDPEEQSPKKETEESSDE